MRSNILIACICLLMAGPSMAQDYPGLAEIEQQLQQIAAENPGLISLESMGKTTGGKDIWVLSLAAAGAPEPGGRPAVFIGANIEGYRLSATAAAMATLNHLLQNRDDKRIAGLLSNTTFYLAPVLNPDGMADFMSAPASGNKRNGRPINEDADDQVDEDGPDDLNGDGFITMMRYPSPEGTMIIDPDDERLMRKADALKGELGKYVVIKEGVDNDADGRINEDGPGGVIINSNFPHDYQYFADGAGPHPASEPETIAIIEFFLAHPNIALVYNFGEESNLLNLKKGKQAGKAGSDMVKVPRRFARFLGLEPEQEMHIDELVELIKASSLGQRMEITRERVLQFIGGGPAMSIQNNDWPLYEKIAEEFKDAVKEAGLPERNDDPRPALGDGSLVSWAYYHYGVPSFSNSVWGLPKLKKAEEKEEEGLTLEKLKGMSSDEFLALGEEKIDAFIKSRGAENRINAKRLMQMVEGGQLNPGMMAKMMAAQPGGKKGGKKDESESLRLNWMAENLDNGGFVQWQPFDHPKLGAVEIGGLIPLAAENPPLAALESAMGVHAAFAVKLAEKLARIQVAHPEVKELSPGVYEITAYVANHGFLPTASAQGALNGNVPPVIVRIDLKGGSLISGMPMHRFNSISGLGLSSQMRWVVRSGESGEMEISATSAKSGSSSITLSLK